MNITRQIELEEAQGTLPPKYALLMKQFFNSFTETRASLGLGLEEIQELFSTFLALVVEQCRDPYHFELYHTHITSPFNYYQFGIDLISGIVDRKASTARNQQYVAEMCAHLKAGENIVLLANHQTEVDPQIMSILLEGSYPDFARELIFVAGERVITDPMATPLSMGRNLLCIYSKRYMDVQPERREEKQAHNRRTMMRMAQLLAEGGRAIYVAPSGGRDRPDGQGGVPVAPFDPQSIEMFRLMALRSGKPCRFYPLALASYNILPPPDSLAKELGEARYTKGGGVHIAFGKEIEMDHFPGSDERDKHKRRAALAEYAWSLVNALYEKLPKQG